MAQKCEATAKSTGQQCNRWAIEGARTCLVHGSGTRKAREAAKRRVAEAQAVRVVAANAEAALAHAALRPVQNPLDQLAMLANEAIAWKDALAARVNALTSIRYTGAMGAEQIRAEIGLYERAIDRTAKLLDALAKLGFDERRLQLDEQTGALVAAVIRASFEAMLGMLVAGLTAAGLTPAVEIVQRVWTEQVPIIVPRELRRLGEGA